MATKRKISAPPGNNRHVFQGGNNNRTTAWIMNVFIYMKTILTGCQSVRRYSGWPRTRRTGTGCSPQAVTRRLPPRLLHIAYRDGSLSPGLKWLEHETDHWPLSRVDTKNAWIHTFTPPYIFIMPGLIKHRNNFCFTRFLTLIYSSFAKIVSAYLFLYNLQMKQHS
jgi:hypothetical protein